MNSFTSEPLAPETLVCDGSYKIQWLTSSNEFSRSYVAIEQATGAKVILMEFCAEGPLANDLRAGFVAKVKKLMGFHHSNYASPRSLFVMDGNPVAVFPYYGAHSLARLIEQHAIDTDARLEVIEKTGSALYSLHEEKIPHCNVCAENIIIRSDNNEPVLTSFGLLALPLAEAIDHDIQGLATTLYFAIEGRPADPSAESPEFLNTGTPATCNAIRRALSPERSEHPADIGEFFQLMSEEPASAEDEAATVQEQQEQYEETEPLAQFSDDDALPLPSTPTYEQEEEFSPDPEANGKNRKKYLIAACALLGVIIIAVLAWFAFTPATPAGTDAPEAVVAIENVSLSIEMDSTSYSVIYTGSVNDAKVPHGEGKAVFKDSKWETYEGEFENGVACGQGTLTFRNRDTMKGTFRNGRMVEGTYTIAEDGSSYTGTFRDKQPCTGDWKDASGKLLQHLENGEVAEAPASATNKQ